MQRLRMGLIAGATMFVAAGAAGAQLRNSASVPPGFIPPAGMCRVWIDGVPPGRQPAPTDCATARANLRANSHLVYGSTQRTDPRNGTYDPRNGTYDPRNGTYDPRNGTYDPRNDGRNDGRYDRRSDRERSEMQKERRKREKSRDKEWKKEHKRGHGDGDDENDDRDDDHDGHHRGRDNSGVYTGRNGQVNQGTWGVPGTNRQPCVDANHDGVCDGQQGIGRVRVP